MFYRFAVPESSFLFELSPFFRDEDHFHLLPRNLTYNLKTTLFEKEKNIFQPSIFTPWKINMEPTNYPFRKENDLPDLHDYVPC